MSSEQKENSLLSYDSFTPPQNAAIDALYGGNTLLIAQKGFGKAAVGQTAAQELLADGELSRVLIVCPLKVALLTWKTEWKKWSHLQMPGMAIGDAGIRRAAIEGTRRLVVLNFENLSWFFEEFGHRHGFDGLLVDEISKLKSVGGTTMKSLRPHLKDFKWRAGMSASPVAECGVDIYSQAMVVDMGAALGRNKEMFMRKHFYPTDWEQRNWAILPGQGPVLAEKLSDMVYVADDPEYEASLPELRDEIVNVEMPPEIWTLYEQMAGEMFLGDEDDPEAEAANQAVVSGKLQQISAGAVYRQDKSALWLHWEKFEALDRLIRDADGPVAVAYNFEFEKEELRVSYPHMVFLGDDAVQVEADWTAGRISLMGIHPKSCSHGINLQYGGHELICLTVPWGADPWEQTLGRFRRRGQKSAFVRRTVIVARGTVDEVVLERHIGKAQDEGALMAHIKQHARK